MYEVEVGISGQVTTFGPFADKQDAKSVQYGLERLAEKLGFQMWGPNQAPHDPDGAIFSNREHTKTFVVKLQKVSAEDAA